MINLGDKITVTIDDVAFGGEGVARCDNFVIFIPFVIQGETVEAEITELKKSFGRARLAQVLQPSPERTTPRCPHFGLCGGCQYQHVVYERQLQIKHKQISDVFQRIGGFDPAIIRPLIPCPRPYNYRNRIMIRSQWNKLIQGLHLGFLRHDCGLVEDIKECHIADIEVNELLTKARLTPPHKGGLKVVLRVNPENWTIPPDSFFQNNNWLLPKLIQTARECLVQSKVRHLVDMYCGVGFFGIELADAVESFVGVEIDRQAIKSATINAEKHGCKNGKFITGDAGEMLPSILAQYQAEQCAVLLDPPRVGCSPDCIRTLRAAKPAQIIYVSCNPATIARDLNVLCADGVYKLVSVTPLDMFPQTQHMECVADIRVSETITAQSAVGTEVSQ